MTVATVSRNPCTNEETELTRVNESYTLTRVSLPSFGSLVPYYPVINPHVLAWPKYKS